MATSILQSLLIQIIAVTFLPNQNQEAHRVSHSMPTM